MELSAPDLENDHIRLEIFGESERDFIAKSGAIQDMWDWEPRIPGRGTTFDAYFDFMMTQVETGRVVPFLAYRKPDNAFAGGVSFYEPSRTHRRVKVASAWIVPEMRGTHIFTAMQAALIRRAHDWRARRMSWQVDTRNTPLRSALERLGIPSEGVLRSVARLNNGEWSDIVVHALVQDEIRDAADRLEAVLEPVD
ncbi:MAG: GNAT family protein [Pseudomonadota bacterium]